MSKGFYRAFEDKLRGSRDLIVSRLRVYLPFVKPLITIYPDGRAVDLGCGRGEWLELMKSIGVSATGVDLDPDMVAACEALGLSVEMGDAVACLKRLPDNSQIVVSGFHIAEHLAFDELQVLVQQALRVLKPAGLLILETPNPENIMVGGNSFYLDPTHQRPIPPQLLEFLPEFYGFERVKIVRLQESPDLARGEEGIGSSGTDPSVIGPRDTSSDGKVPIGLMAVLGGASPDYSVVAQKAADESTLSLFAPPFDREYGLKVDTLAQRFDLGLQAIAAQSGQALAAVEHAEETAAQAQAQARQARASAQQAESDARKARADARQARTDAQQAIQQVHDVYASTSWRVTAPVRWVGMQAQRLRSEGFASRSTDLGKKLARPVLRSSTRYVDSRPLLRQRISGLAHRLGIHQTLHDLYLRIFNSTQQNGLYGVAPGKPLPSGLTPRAARVYFQLKESIAQKNNESLTPDELDNKRKSVAGKNNEAESIDATGNIGTGKHKDSPGEP